MARYDLWVSAVGAVVQSPVTATTIVVDSTGLKLEQSAGTNNWVLFALPTPTVIANVESRLARVNVFGQADPGVTINRVVVSNKGIEIQSTPVNWPDQIQGRIDSKPSLKIKNPRSFVLAVFIEFAQAGSIKLFDAGAAFVTTGDDFATPTAVTFPDKPRTPGVQAT